CPPAPLRPALPRPRSSRVRLSPPPTRPSWSPCPRVSRCRRRWRVSRRPPPPTPPGQAGRRVSPRTTPSPRTGRTATRPASASPLPPLAAVAVAVLLLLLLLVLKDLQHRCRPRPRPSSTPSSEPSPIASRPRLSSSTTPA
ncbi:unnamed protein product, partial [Ectocarpus sp. 8 AP-2014]